MLPLCQLHRELELHILARTGRRVRDLAVHLSTDRVVLQGHAATYHVKQLAQQGAREVVPDLPLENAIVVR